MREASQITAKFSLCLECDYTCRFTLEKLMEPYKWEQDMMHEIKEIM